MGKPFSYVIPKWVVHAGQPEAMFITALFIPTQHFARPFAHLMIFIQYRLANLSVLQNGLISATEKWIKQIVNHITYIGKTMIDCCIDKTTVVREPTDPTGLERIHPNAKGLRLYKIIGDELIGCELVMFTEGRPAVITTLRRASISGLVCVEPFEGPQDYFADVYTDQYTFEQTVLLDRKSYKALKTKWMRTNIE
jgi:hypothetical protein